MKRLVSTCGLVLAVTASLLAQTPPAQQQTGQPAQGGRGQGRGGPQQPPRDPPPDDPPPPRWPGFIPPPLRLPRNCGAISAANRSALMVPLRRTVRCKSPITIEVVVSPVTEPPPSFFEESRSRLK